MKTFLTALVFLVIVTALYAWSSGSSSLGSKVQWEFKQVVMLQTVLQIPPGAGDREPTKDEQDQMKGSLESSLEQKTEFEAALKKAGQDGWDLVTVIVTPPQSLGKVAMYSHVAYLKRQKN